MSGKEIRRAMWQRAKERQGFLLLVSLVGFLPYFMLAHAAFAETLFQPEKRAQKREKRAM